MPTVILICTLFTLGVDTAQDASAVVKFAKAVHHHVTRPAYRHTIKPLKDKIHGE
jgi:hypothetical protein